MVWWLFVGVGRCRRPMGELCGGEGASASEMGGRHPTWLGWREGSQGHCGTLVDSNYKPQCPWDGATLRVLVEMIPLGYLLSRTLTPFSSRLVVCWPSGSGEKRGPRLAEGDAGPETSSDSESEATSERDGKHRFATTSIKNPGWCDMS
jgi:hypothetical protein